jgi:hypothetical protein
MKAIYKILGGLILTSIGSVLMGLFRKKTRSSQPKDSSSSDGRPRYGKHSKRLWEDTPRCRGNTKSDEFEYKSEFKNIKGEPVFYPGGERLSRVLPTFRNRRGKLKPKTDGFFNAHPGGLNIDQYTGEIDVNESDTGIRYVVEYTPCGKKCVTSANVVVSGIGYEGRIVSLSKSGPDGPDGFLLRPHYFGSTAEQLCGVPSEGVPRGTFGLDDPKHDPRRTGLVIDPKSGEVDIRATIRQGALGFGRDGKVPENGTSKNFQIYYRLDSGPAKGKVNKTSLRVHFYHTKADIPEELLVRIRQQNNSIYRNSFSLPLLLGMAMTSVTSLQDIPWEGIAALLAALSSFLFLSIGGNPCRPPEVVVLD